MEIAVAVAVAIAGIPITIAVAVTTAVCKVMEIARFARRFGIVVFVFD